MNIVLAGATGNIGSRILDEALRRGHRVTGLTRDPAKLAARSGLQAKKANTAEVAPARTMFIASFPLEDRAGR